MGQRLDGIGLTLSGGGSGGVGAMLGFSSALDLLILSHDVNDFGLYSGISAGSIVASYLVAGISPHDLIRAHMTGPTGGIVPFRSGDVARVNWGEILATPYRAAIAAVQAVGRALGRSGDGGLETLGFLPSAPYRHDRVGEVVRANLERGGANDFSKLPCRLSVVFFDLLRNERIVCGNGPDEVSEIPVHEAVTASAAIPGAYTPCRLVIGGRTVFGVDGGTGGVQLSFSGAEGLPVVLAFNHQDPPEREDVAHASALAILGLAYQVLFNWRNIDAVATFIDSHPQSHVFLFEPSPEGAQGMLSLTAAFEACEATFEATKRRLAEEFEYLALALEGCGARLNPAVAEVGFADVRERGREVKEELRRRHGVARAQ